MERACAQYRAVEIPVLALEEPDEHTLARIERECRAALDPRVGGSGR
jgi:allantoin racemase